MTKNSKVYVAGSRGLVGSALVRALTKAGYENVITRTRQELDLTDQQQVEKFFATEKPEYIFMAAARVGGIMANKTRPAQFFYENMTMTSNVIHAAYLHKVKKLLNLGSVCIYPKLAAQPISEDALLTGPLEETNRAYAVAKIAGIVQCQSYNAQYGTNFISLMPTNLYGPNDNYDLEGSHVLPALIRKFHEAKKSGAGQVALWGTGKPTREFLHADDMASACIFLMKNYDSSEIVNVGAGEDISIKDLAEKVRAIVGYTGEILWDTSKPDGTPRRKLDVSKLYKLGWQPSLSLNDGLLDAYQWFLEHEDSLVDRK